MQDIEFQKLSAMPQQLYLTCKLQKCQYHMWQHFIEHDVYQEIIWASETGLVSVVEKVPLPQFHTVSKLLSSTLIVEILSCAMKT